MKKNKQLKSELGRRKMGNVQFVFLFLPAPKIYFSVFFVDIRIIGTAGLKVQEGGKLWAWPLLVSQVKLPAISGRK